MSCQQMIAFRRRGEIKSSAPCRIHGELWLLLTSTFTQVTPFGRIA